MMPLRTQQEQAGPEAPAIRTWRLHRPLPHPGAPLSPAGIELPRHGSSDQTRLTVGLDVFRQGRSQRVRYEISAVLTGRGASSAFIRLLDGGTDAVLADFQPRLLATSVTRVEGQLRLKAARDLVVEARLVDDARVRAMAFGGVGDGAPRVDPRLPPAAPRRISARGGARKERAALTFPEER
jgi:hypothetical protein